MECPECGSEDVLYLDDDQEGPEFDVQCEECGYIWEDEE